MVGPARREEGLWGRLSGELRVPRFRCGGDQKGWGEWQVNLFHWRFCTNIASHTHTHWNTQKKYTHVPGSDCFSPSCSSAMMGPLLRAAGWLMNYVLLCQPKGSNIYLLASAGWPKIEEMGWLLEYSMCWTQKPFLSPIRSVNVDVLLKAKPCCRQHTYIMVLLS